MTQQGLDTESFIARLKNTWEKSGGDKNCPVCRASKWTVSDSLAVLIPIEPTTRTLKLGAGGFPVVAVACTVCGYTMLFNAIIAEVMDHDGPAPAPEKTEEAKAEGEDES